MKNRTKALPLMLCFFAMGFVDLVGIASNYVKADLGLTDAQANLFPSLVFFWFLLFSIPTSLLMNRIGRKRTVLLSLGVTAASLLVPILGGGFHTMLLAFSLLGIGNALMQTSLNPLVATVMQGGNLASTLTFGQFVKAIASFMAPYIAMWGSQAAIPSFGLGWRVLFPVYLGIGVAAALLLGATPIREPQPEQGRTDGLGRQFASALALLGRPAVLLCFVGIMCHVGIDVGTNTTAPKLLMERLGMGLDEAAFATSLYFIFRTVGCFTGSFILQRMSSRTFLLLSVLMMALAMGGMWVGTQQGVIYASIALVGYGNSNVFSICFARALEAAPDRGNEVSGLMIMGLFGGTVFPLLMGFAADAMGQAGAVAVMAAGVAYLGYYQTKA